MAESIVLVCGFGRCGSSLTLQMLRAGGMEVVGDYPAFEPDEMRPMKQSGNRVDEEWLLRQSGRALKVLDPHLYILPRGPRYRTVWLTRDRTEQARSQVKFCRMIMGIRTNRGAIKALSESYIADKPKAVRALFDAGCGDILELNFEALIGPERRETATALARFVDRNLNVDAMIGEVLSRGPECQPGMEIELSLMAEANA